MGDCNKMPEDGYVCTLDKLGVRVAAKELNEQPKERALQVESLRNWIEKQPHIKSRTDDNFLLRFLRRAKFSQLQAQELLDNFWTTRTVPDKGAPEWFSHMDPLDPKLQKVMDLGYQFPLPGRDPLGRKVILIRTGAYDPKTQDFGDLMKIGFMTTDVLLMEEANQVHGFVILLDFSDFTAAHVCSWSRDIIQKAVKCWQLHFHKDDLNSLYKQVPKSMLPNEYGGKSGTIQQLIQQWKDELVKNKAEFDLNAGFGVEENKRPEKHTGDGWGVTGSFRKLAVD